MNVSLFFFRVSAVKDSVIFIMLLFVTTVCPSYEHHEIQEIEVKV